MAAIVPRYQRRASSQVPNVTPQRAPSSYYQTSMGELGQGLDAVGDMFQDWQDEVDTADAKLADAQYSDRVRQLLYDEQNGFMYTDGANALARREEVSTQLQELHREVLGGLNPRARQKAATALEARRQQALQSVDSHTAGQREGYLNTAAEARQRALLNDAISDPTLAPTRLRAAEQEIRDTAERLGQPPEWVDQKITEARTAVHLGVINRMWALNPQSAFDYYMEHREDIDGPTRASIERELIPAVKRHEGRQIGASAYERDGVSGSAQAALAALETAAGRTFNINSAYRTEQENEDVGGADNSQHMVGNAFDIDVSDMSTAERLDLIRMARAAGFGGIGIYENTLHFDVGPTRAWGPDYHSGSIPEWASAVVEMPRGEAPKGSSVADLVNIEDPIVREAAMREAEMRQTWDTNQRAIAAQEAQDGVYAKITQWVAEGAPPSLNPVAGVSPEVRETIGMQGMAALERYAENAAKGRTYTTTAHGWTIYTKTTTLIQQAASNTVPPEVRQEAIRQLREANPLADWRDNLSDTEYKQLVTSRAAILNPQTTGDGGVDPIAVQTAMARYTPVMEAAGVEKGSAEYAQIQSRFIEWRSSNPDLASDDAAVDRYMTGLLTEVWLNPPGVANKIEKRVYQLDIGGGRTLTEDDDVTREMIDDAISNEGLWLGDNQVSGQHALFVYDALVRSLNGIPEGQEYSEGDIEFVPSAEQLMMALAAYYQ